MDTHEVKITYHGKRTIVEVNGVLAAWFAGMHDPVNVRSLLRQLGVKFTEFTVYS